MPQSLVCQGPRAKHGLCSYNRTYKPTGVLCAAPPSTWQQWWSRGPFPKLMGRGNYPLCYPFPLQSDSWNSGEVFTSGETPPTLSTLYYKLLYRFTRLWV